MGDAFADLQAKHLMQCWTSQCGDRPIAVRSAELDFVVDAIDDALALADEKITSRAVGRAGSRHALQPARKAKAR
jgi:hypothetical protein